MTNQAIIIIQEILTKNGAIAPSPLQKVNGKAFLHYQLQFLSDNLFEKIVLLYPNEEDEYLEIFGNKYLGIDIIYLSYNPDKKQSGNVLEAMQYISIPYVFVFNANNYFRLNLAKADNYRRMRDSKILLIGKKAEGINSQSEKLFLNEKGKIINIIEAIDTENTDTFNTETWLLNIKTFTQLFNEKNQSILKDFLQAKYKSSPLFCLACKQYFITIMSNEDIEKAENDFEENYY